MIEKTKKIKSQVSVSSVWRRAQAALRSPALAGVGHLLYLAEVLLAVVLEVPGVYVDLVLVYSVRPRVFARFLHKLLNFHCRLMLPYVIKRFDWNEGGSYTVFKRTEEKTITY